LLLRQLRLLSAFAAKAGLNAALDLERAEDVAETRQQTLLFFLCASHRATLPGEASSTLFEVAVEELAAHANIVDVMVSGMDHADRFGDARVLRRVTLDVGPDALPVEGVPARVHEELAVIEHRPEANVAILRRVYRDVPIFHVAALSA